MRNKPSRDSTNKDEAQVLKQCFFSGTTMQMHQPPNIFWMTPLSKFMELWFLSVEAFQSGDYIICFSSGSSVSEGWNEMVMEWIDNHDSGNLGETNYFVILYTAPGTVYCLLLLCAKASHASASSKNLNNCK